MKSYLFPFLCIISLCLLFNSKSHLYIDKKKVYRLILVYILKKVYIIFINKLDKKIRGGGTYLMDSVKSLTRLLTGSP